MSSNSHHDHSSRSRAPITIVSTDQGPRVGPYIFGKTLGTGSTGKVKLAKNLVTGEIVAIKIVRKDYLDNKPSLKKKMRREISVLKVLSHPNLMSLIDVFEIDTHLFLVMEYVDGFELFEYLVRRGALPIQQALGFFQQIICGLEYCHRRLICHRDLKPENLLLDRSHLHIKIADFGMTSLNPPGNFLETSCGSPHYCDPMVVSGEVYDGLKADIWSCGVILYAMVTGRLPFDDDNIQRLLQKVQMGQYHLPSELPKDLRDLIKKMLTVDPEQRITLDGIKLHPWFNSIPPKNYVEDNFDVPVEPINHPDPMIMRSLVDLGWGDVQHVTLALGKRGRSMEKVFYQQLEKHPMYRRSNVSRGNHGSNSSSGNAGTRKPLPHDSSHRPNTSRAEGHAHQRISSTQNPPNSNIEVSNTGNSSSNGRASENGDASLSVKLQSLSVSSHGEAETTSSPVVNANGSEVMNTSTTNDQDADDDNRQQLNTAEADVSSARVKKTGETEVNLVRQSSLREMTVTADENREDKVEDAIQNVSGDQPKSWFDSMRSIWGGQHPDGAGSSGSNQDQSQNNQNDEDQSDTS